MSRTEREWRRLGSEAQSEDARAGIAVGALSASDLEATLDYHFGDDLDDPTICDDRKTALAALVSGYRDGG